MQQECKLLQGIGGHFCYSGIFLFQFKCQICLFQYVICPINDNNIFRLN